MAKRAFRSSGNVPGRIQELVMSVSFFSVTPYLYERYEKIRVLKMRFIFEYVSNGWETRCIFVIDRYLTNVIT